MASAFEKISTGLNEAIQFSKGDLKKTKVHNFTSVDIKNIRLKTGLTQKEFAGAFGISLGTLRHWERGDRQPRGPALVLLNVLKNDPDAVFQALAA